MSLPLLTASVNVISSLSMARYASGLICSFANALSTAWPVLGFSVFLVRAWSRGSTPSRIKATSPLLTSWRVSAMSASSIG